MLRRDDGEIFGRVGQLHAVRLLAREIDQDLIEEKIPLGHAAEAPALVQTEGAGLQFFELIRGAGGEFSGFNKLFQFGIHAGRRSYGERLGARAKIGCAMLASVLLPILLLILILFDHADFSRDHE